MSMPALVTDLNGSEGARVTVVDCYSVLPKENVNMSIGMHISSCIFSLIVLVVLIRASAKTPKEEDRLMSWLMFFATLAAVAGFAGAAILLTRESSAVAC